MVYTFYNNLFSDSSAATVYVSSVLGPVLDLMSQYQDRIYAFDLINEIEAAINAGYFSYSWLGAQAWIRNMTTLVKSHKCAIPSCKTIGEWLPVTVSAGGGYAVQELTFGFFSGQGLNFYDVHIYSDAGQYSGQTALCLRTKFVDHLPIILGEYGQKSTAVSDPIQNRATANFLSGAINSCFSSALAWKYELTHLPGLTGSPWLSYLDIDTSGNLLTPSPSSPCPSPHVGVPGPACARPAYYTTIKNFCNLHQCAP
jgi:hypothetical protein